MQKLCLWVLFFLFNYEQFTIYFSSCFRLLHFFSSVHVSNFFTFHKNLLQKNESPDLNSIHQTRFFFKIIQHYETWNVIAQFPSYKLEEIELITVVSYKYLYNIVWIRYFTQSN